MYAGVAAVGAEDAWHITCMEIEELTLEGTPFCGGTADIMKFFDQIPREVVYRIAERTRMPSRVLKAYREFQESLKIRNSLAGTLGKEYKKKNSIPQGCPLSMAITALLLRPWLVMVKEAGAQGCVLADDMLVLCEGPAHALIFEHVFDQAHLMVQDVGANLAPRKSYNFSSDDDM